MQGEWRNVKGGGTVEDFIQTPKYAKAVSLERSRYYNEALNALEKLPDDSPSSEQLASFIERDPWKVLGSEFLPIPENIAALTWEDARDPFTDVGDSLDAISDFRAESLAAEIPITMKNAPEWFWDPQFDQENPNQIIESLE